MRCKSGLLASIRISTGENASRKAATSDSSFGVLPGRRDAVLKMVMNDHVVNGVLQLPAPFNHRPCGRNVPIHHAQGRPSKIKARVLHRERDSLWRFTSASGSSLAISSSLRTCHAGLPFSSLLSLLRPLARTVCWRTSLSTAPGGRFSPFPSVGERAPSMTRFAALQNCWYPPGYPSSRSVPQMTRQVNPLSFAACNSERTALRSLALS